MKRVLTGLLASIMLVSAFPVYSFAAEGDVEINETNFPDESVRYVVKKADKDKNNVLSQEEIAAVTELKFSSYPAPLADMTGLEQFTNVETLSISSSSMTEMDCSIFPKLTTLKCGSNSSVKKLDVSKNTELVTLDCSGDKIEALDLSSNTKLETAKVNSNNLSVLTLGDNTNLKELNCYNNKLTELNVSGCTALEKLTCSNNMLVNLDLTNNTELKELYVNNNRTLKSLDITKCTKLTKIDTRYTEAMKELDLRNNSALENVSASYGGLVNVYLGNSYPNLKNLSLDTNAIVEVDLSGVTNTGYINLRDNALTSLDVSGCLESANIQTTGNQYDIEVDETRTFDLSTLPGKFDVNKASGWTGGTVSGNILTVDEGAEKVTYNYDAGRNLSVNFTLNVKEKTFALGDVNMDGKINVDDSTAIQYYLVGKPIEGTFNLELADFNGDEKIDISDATCIQLELAKNV